MWTRTNIYAGDDDVDSVPCFSPWIACLTYIRSCCLLQRCEMNISSSRHTHELWKLRCRQICLHPWMSKTKTLAKGSCTNICMLLTHAFIHTDLLRAGSSTKLWQSISARACSRCVRIQYCALASMESMPLVVIQNAGIQFFDESKARAAQTTVYPQNLWAVKHQGLLCCKAHVCLHHGVVDLFLVENILKFWGSTACAYHA